MGSGPAVDLPHAQHRELGASTGCDGGCIDLWPSSGVGGGWTRYQGCVVGGSRPYCHSGVVPDLPEWNRRVKRDPSERKQVHRFEGILPEP